MRDLFDVKSFIQAGLTAVREHFLETNPGISPLVFHTIATLREQTQEFFEMTEELLRDKNKEVEALKNKVEELQYHNSAHNANHLQDTICDMRARWNKTMVESDFWSDEIELMKRGNRIGAIKLHRQRTGADLKKSKELVDKHMDFLEKKKEDPVLMVITSTVL